MDAVRAEATHAEEAVEAEDMDMDTMKVEGLTVTISTASKSVKIMRDASFTAVNVITCKNHKYTNNFSNKISIYLHNVHF